MWWTRHDVAACRPQVRGRHRRRSRSRCVPRAEILEGRTLLALGVVTSLADDGTAGTLRSVMAAAQSGDTVTFTAALANQTIFLDPAKGPLIVNKDLTIVGPGNSAGSITIDGQQKVRIFQISVNTIVNLKNMTITDGSANTFGGGGGIYSEGRLTITNSAVTNNTSTATAGQTAAGGGVDNDMGVLSIVNSTVSGNSAVGGALLNIGNMATFNAGGGGIASINGPLSITSSSKILNNAATGGIGFFPAIGGAPGPGGNAWGGGVYVTEDSLTLSASTIAGNSVTGGLGIQGLGGQGGNGDGAGIYVDAMKDDMAQLTVSGCLITGNQAICVRRRHSQ